VREEVVIVQSNRSFEITLYLHTYLPDHPSIYPSTSPMPYQSTHTILKASRAPKCMYGKFGFSLPTRTSNCTWLSYLPGVQYTGKLGRERSFVGG